MQREDHKRLFGETRSSVVQVTMLEETYDEACQIARENDWEQDYANLIIFSNGISFLQGKAVLQQVNSGDSKAGETIQRLTAELQKYMAMYSTMKYQAFLKTSDNESMDWAINALRIENGALKNRLDLFRADEERLKAELQRLRAENSDLRARIAEFSPALQVGRDEPLQTHGPNTLKAWLTRILRRGK
ncbi:MAG: hypothetical protein HYX82_02195 [Chloroflexi bacterium]|nr:hypothetical protein [Chloroflexota bacterium]